MLKKTISIVSITSVLFLSGCASTGLHPKDPFEGFNRAMYSVHSGIDSTVLKPVAKGYDYVAPEPVKTGVSNFFGNISDIPNMANNLLQGNLSGFANDLWRVLLNTTVGIGGLFDPASALGLEKHDQDFGQTLAKWGVGDGPYLFIPILGPGNIRDTSGKFVDLAMFDPIGNVSDIPIRNSLYASRTVDKRYNLLPADKVLEEAAFDKYQYIRNAYFQMRYYQINGKYLPLDDDSAATESK